MPRPASLALIALIALMASMAPPSLAALPATQADSTPAPTPAAGDAPFATMTGNQSALRGVAQVAAINVLVNRFWAGKRFRSPTGHSASLPATRPLRPRPRH